MKTLTLKLDSKWVKIVTQMKGNILFFFNVWVKSLDMWLDSPVSQFKCFIVVTKLLFLLETTFHLSSLFMNHVKGFSFIFKHKNNFIYSSYSRFKIISQIENYFLIKSVAQSSFEARNNNEGISIVGVSIILNMNHRGDIDVLYIKG